MNRNFWAIVCGLLLAAGAGVVAQSGTIRLVPSASLAPRFAERWKPVTTADGETKIVGTVIDINQRPVANLRVQLRSLIDGKVLQVSTTNENGECSFLIDEPGTYVVESVLPNGQVVGLSNAGSLGRYETLRTVVQLPGHWNAELRTMTLPRNLAGFAGVSSRTSMTASTLSIAVDSNIRPVNAGEPVSATSQGR